MDVQGGQKIRHVGRKLNMERHKLLVKNSATGCIMRAFEKKAIGVSNSVKIRRM